MESKVFSKDDLEMGIEFEKMNKQAHDTYHAVNSAFVKYIETLRERYNAPEGEYELRVWEDGFVKTESESDLAHSHSH